MDDKVKQKYVVKIYQVHDITYIKYYEKKTYYTM